MLRVAVNGYGTIGKRVADAVCVQPDMELIGVAKVRPDYVATGAAHAGYPLYTVDPAHTDSFRQNGIEVAGPLEELVETSDIVVDTTPGGIGIQNRPLYEQCETPALFQGGEAPDVADVSFNSRVNFEDAIGVDYVRVVSCNTTGLSRLLGPLAEFVGIEKARVTLIRRGGDPNQTDRGPINDVVPDPVTVPSHHGPDVQTVFPGLSIDTIGLKVPTTQMHVHVVNVTLNAPAAEADVRERLEREPRLVLVPGSAEIDGTGTLKEFARDSGRPRGDIWENCIWEESITVDGREFYCVQAIHQEADVVPENIDALRAVAGTHSGPESRTLTNRTLGIGFERFQQPPTTVADRPTAD